MREIWIIGTEPPCPRCALLTEQVGALVEQHGLQVRVRHLAFDAEDAAALAREQGCRVGTAKHVARDLGLEIDVATIGTVIMDRRTAVAAARGIPPGEVPAADTWTPRLDELLEPFRRQARDNDYLMTPVIVIDGEVVHHGSVPDEEALRRLIVR